MYLCTCKIMRLKLWMRIIPSMDNIEVGRKQFEHCFSTITYLMIRLPQNTGWCTSVGWDGTYGWERVVLPETKVYLDKPSIPSTLVSTE